MNDFKLSVKEIESLKQLHHSMHHKKGAYRVNAIILLGMGMSIEEVATNLLLSERTIQRCLETYQQGGIDLLVRTMHQGGISKMSLEQEDRLCQHLDTHLLGTANEVVAYVKETFDIDYTAEGMVITRAVWGYSYKKTKLHPTKADKEKQKAFVDYYQALKDSLNLDEKIFFMDGF